MNLPQVWQVLWKMRSINFLHYIVNPLGSLMFWEIPFVGIPLIVAWLLIGAIYFTLRMRFVNIRLFRHAII